MNIRMKLGTKALFAATAVLLDPSCFAGPSDLPFLLPPQADHTFDGNVAVKTIYDGYGDGKPDRIYHFSRHYIERAEWDTDLDGTIDLRATYQKPAKGESNLIYEFVGAFDGQYRLIPRAVVMEYPSHQYFSIYGDPAPHYEAHVDEKWTSSFAIELPPLVDQPVHGDTTDGKMEFVCKEGAAVSLTTRAEAGGEYRQTIYKQGKVVRSVKGASPERISEKIKFLYGEEPRSITLTDRDGDGEFDYEITSILPPLNHMTIRKKNEGGWTGTFIEENVRYVDGLLTEVFAHGTKDVVERREYDKEGKMVWAYNDSNYDGEFDRRRKPDGTTHKRINGKWVGDFTEQTSGPSTRGSMTYRDGRLVGSEHTNYKEQRQDSTQYPEPGVEISSSSGHGLIGQIGVTIWKYYKATEMHPFRNRLLRTAHDMNADGKPELFVDYQALTISKTRPADWPD